MSALDHWVEVRNRSRPGPPLLRARWCADFASRLRGLTFRPALPEGEGLVLVEARPGRLATAIHMWMVRFPIGVLWLDENRRVVDRRLARPWGVYLPARAARFVVEGPPALLEGAQLDDLLEFADAAA